MDRDAGEFGRAGDCFFWKHRPGMMFAAAQTLQKREAEAAEARRDRQHVIRGLWITAGGLLIAAIALLVDVWLRLAGAFSE